MRSNRFKKSLSVFLSLLMLLTTLAVGVVPLRAKAEGTEPAMLARYFSTSSYTYDAVSKTTGLEKIAGNISFNHKLGMTYFDRAYGRITNEDLFSGVSQETGVTFSFNYRTMENERFRHIISIGQNARNTSDGNSRKHHLFISGARTQHHDNLVQVTWVDSNGNELINAYPADLAQVIGKEYNVVVTIDKDEGVVFYVDGVKKTTVYVNSDLNSQIGNIRSFLDEINTYRQNYVGCSRWDDPHLMGYLSDLRIYNRSVSDAEAYNIEIDMATVSQQFNDGGTLIGRYFSTSNVWYEAVQNNGSGVEWQADGYPAYRTDGWTYINTYYRMTNENLFASVNRDTGVTFAFDYIPDFAASEQFRHVVSIGKNVYGNGTANHLFISGAHTQHSSNLVQVTWVNSSGAELINAYADGVPQVEGKAYNIVVAIDKDEGVVFYVDGVKKNTVYVNSSLAGQIENIRSFLDEVNQYKQNYIGVSRWTADKKINGRLHDLCIYKHVFTDDEVRNMLADRAVVAQNLNAPSFNATAYHYEDPANGAYANLAYASPATSEDGGMGIRGADNSDNYKDVASTYFKLFNPLKIVMVYDGAHEACAPVQMETKKHDQANVDSQKINYAVSNSSALNLKQYWKGYMDNEWKKWAGAYVGTEISVDPNNPSSVTSDNKNTPRFWWNALKYTGTGNNDTYLDHESNVSYTIAAYWHQTTGFGNLDHYDTGTITTNSDYYILNYKPVYNILSAASNKYSSEMSGKDWMYTESSYAQALLAMRRLTLCDPNLYDYEGRGVDTASQLCAAAIKQAKADYDSINLVKKTATVHITEGTGTTLNVSNNGSVLIDGATVNYGDTLSVTAVAQSAYDQGTASYTITGGTVSGNTTLVNEPDIYISTNDLDLNTYTLTFDPNSGTLSGDASVTAIYTQPLPAATPASRDGYTFQRYLYSTGSSDYTYYNQNLENVHGNYDVKDDVTVVAQWTPADYSITFVANGGTIDASALSNFGGNYTIEDTKTLPTATAPVGYHFDGWTVAATNIGDSHGWGTEKIAQNASVEGMWGDVTLTATFAPNTNTAYNVEYYEMGTDGAYPETATRTVNLTGTTGATVSADTTAPAGFTFDRANAGNVLSSAIAADGSTVLKVYLSRNKYTVTVTLGEGTSLNVANGAQYYYGETVTLTAAALEGYDAAGLKLYVNDAETENGSQITVTGNVDVHTDDLSLAITYYTVTFVNYNGDPLYETRVAEGGTAVYLGQDPPESPADDEFGHHYGFIGWNKPLDNITEDTIFVAQFAIMHDFSVYDYNTDGHWLTCSICGRADESTSAVHDLTTITERTADCTTEGIAHYYCETCGYVSDSFSTGLNESNHIGTISDVPAVEGNCCTEGFTAGTFCSACEKYVTGHTSTGYVTTEAGHSYGEYVSNGDGTHNKICTRPGCTEDTPNHTVTGETCIADPATAATCSTKQKCRLCAGDMGNYNPDVHSAELQPVEEKDATCTESGNYAYYVCPGCGRYYSDSNAVNEIFLVNIVKPALGHEWTITWTWNDTVSPPTATAAFVCGRDHDHDDTVNATVTVLSSSSADCGSTGTVTYRASYIMDGVTYTTGDSAGNPDLVVETASIPHAWTAESWVWNADHSAVTLNLVCARNPAHTHQITEGITISTHVVSPAACEEDQVVYYSAEASYEGYVFSTDTDYITLENTALGHSYEFVNWDWSADLHSASANFRCTRQDCTHTTLVTDPETEAVTVREADCEYDQVIQYKAEVSIALEKGAEPTAFTDLSAEITEENTKTAHTWGETVYDWNEDHTAVTATRICAKYPEQHIETETVSATYEEVTAPDCTHDGSGKYTSAAFQNPAFSVQTYTVTLTQLGHDFTVETVHENYLKSAATCEDPTVYYKSCVRCGTSSNSNDYTFTSGDPLGHDYVWTETTHPTCTDPGVETGACSRCAATATRPVDPLGHNFDESIEANVTVVDATCTETGKKTVKCSRCPQEKVIVLPALGHDWGEWTVVTAPDYGVPGQDKRECARCHFVEYRTTVLTSDADKFIKFTTVAKMKYILDVGNGFEFDNTITFRWYSAKSLNFRIGIANNADYDSVTVYLNGSVLSPNADGSYTIPARTGNETVTVEPIYPQTPSGNSGSGSGACPYCGQTHANNLWGRIVSLVHTILAFFRNLFRR